MSGSRSGAGSSNNVAAVAAFRARWQQIQPRTRTLLLISTGALLAGLIYAYVWLPAARGRVLNAERIPVLEAKLATMRAQMAEMQRLNAVPPATSASGAAAGTAAGADAGANAGANTVARSVADVNQLQIVFGTSAKIQRDDNRTFRIMIASIGYPSFLDRLDQALSRYRLSVDALDIAALGGSISAAPPDAKTNLPAMVSVEVTLIESAAVR